MKYHCTLQKKYYMEIDMCILSCNVQSKSIDIEICLSLKYNYQILSMWCDSQKTNEKGDDCTEYI